MRPQPKTSSQAQSSITRRAFAGGLTSLYVPRFAVAQSTWPERAVKIIVPLGAGSGADFGARLIGERLQ